MGTAATNEGEGRRADAMAASGLLYVVVMPGEVDCLKADWLLLGALVPIGLAVRPMHHRSPAAPLQHCDATEHG